MRHWLWLIICCLTLLACSKQGEVIIETASGKGLTAEDIDRDPWALLPEGALAWVYLDTRQLFESRFGDQTLALTERAMPIPPEAGFEPKRDLQKLQLGLYSMQGADFAGVASGQFDPQKIEQAASSTAKTPLGYPVEKSRYAERTLYVAGDAGFSVVTPHTVVFGNMTGMRRVLDRIQEGRVERPIPTWLDGLLKTPDAALVLGGDLTSNPLSAATRQQLPFLDGLKTVQLLGNFKDPGLNFAGTLSYDTDAAAERGATNLMNVDQLLKSYGWVMSLLGLAQPIQRLEAHAEDSNTKLVLAVDGQAVAMLLGRADALLPKAP